MSRGSRFAPGLAAGCAARGGQPRDVARELVGGRVLRLIDEGVPALDRRIEFPAENPHLGARSARTDDPDQSQRRFVGVLNLDTHVYPDESLEVKVGLLIADAEHGLVARVEAQNPVEHRVAHLHPAAVRDAVDRQSEVREQRDLAVVIGRDHQGSDGDGERDRLGRGRHLDAGLELQRSFVESPVVDVAPATGELDAPFERDPSGVAVGVIAVVVGAQLQREQRDAFSLNFHARGKTDIHAEDTLAETGDVRRDAPVVTEAGRQGIGCELELALVLQLV